MYRKTSESQISGGRGIRIVFKVEGRGRCLPKEPGRKSSQWKTSNFGTRKEVRKKKHNLGPSSAGPVWPLLSRDGHLRLQKAVGPSFPRARPSGGRDERDFFSFHTCAGLLSWPRGATGSGVRRPNFERYFLGCFDANSSSTGSII